MAMYDKLSFILQSSWILLITFHVIYIDMSIEKTHTTTGNGSIITGKMHY